MSNHIAHLAALSTPCRLLDEAKITRNIDRLADRARSLGVVLRPHLKTGKSVDVARRVLAGGRAPATVSTLAEAEFDLLMAGIDVCTLDNIALSVLTTVIGHQLDRGWIMVDAGWMAMSRDKGTAALQRLNAVAITC